jgi:3-deoxy-D-manno-octulosonic-acid transferase
MGETKALSSLFFMIKDKYKTASIYIASRTITGSNEAKTSLPGADGYFLLPLDFSWNMKRLYKLLQPTGVIVVEGDFWYHFLQQAKTSNVFTCLVSGKISLRSYERFLRFPKFSHPLFSSFSLICAQNEVFKSRFIQLGAHSNAVCVAGNIKLETFSKRLSYDEKTSLKQRLGVAQEDFVLVIGSTHAPEEEKIIQEILPLWGKFPQLKCFVVPRHPSRFLQVNEFLGGKGLSFISYSNLAKKTGKERLISVDVMGLLATLYEIADLAIVAGSFDSRLKGHNIIEPIQKGAPVLFGPYMSDQTDFVSQVLTAGAGIQIGLESLADKLEELLQDVSQLKKLRMQGEEMLSSLESASKKTANFLFSSLWNFKKI